MNKTKIDWADMTWNPVTGCLHGCEYCYARKIANRFGNKYLPYGCGKLEGNILNRPMDGEKGIDPYPFGFEPTFHYYRLTEPQQIKKSQNIFVCSMADLFGDWVPDKWIQMVFNACEEAPQHRYLFLTKNPKRLQEVFGFGRVCDNWWFGTSINNTLDVDSMGLELFSNHHKMNRFISVEPILDQITDCRAGLFNWVIVGAETGNRKEKVVPEKSWIDSISKQCQESNVPIFMKESLRSLMGDDFIQEFPWEDL